ncbi:MAG: chemotaxis protein CheW [Granulosicoccus sp.]
MHVQHQAKESSESTIYGSFSLAESEFALSVSSIQEVVNEPEGYSSVPLAPDYLLGLFDLRGVIVPVVDLRRIFDSPVDDENDLDPRKIAIVEHGDLCLGLLFDATAEVFNADDVETCWFEADGETPESMVVQGVFKLDDGRRVVQILDVHSMLKLEKMPRTANAVLSKKIKTRQGQRKQCISFTVGQSHCALDISSIKEIVNIDKIENKILASSVCLGAIEIRGNTVPIMNFSALLGYGRKSADSVCYEDNSRVIVMNVKNALFGLMVDSIENIISYYDEDLVAFPLLGEAEPDFFAGCISSDDDTQHTIVLKHDELMANEDIASITQGHSDLFQDNSEIANERKQGSLNKKTLITFSLDNRYGLDIGEVSEVIDYPDDLIKTLDMSSHILGMTNLRGELIEVIDSRSLYKMEESGNSTDSKVLVFEKEGVKHGLMVDSVDSIMSFSESDLITVPRIMFVGSTSAIGEDVKKALIVGKDADLQTVCILDLPSVSDRLCL